jgi:hypothetical protein
MKNASEFLPLFTILNILCYSLAVTRKSGGSRTVDGLALLQLNDFRVHENQQFLVFRLFQIGLKQPPENGHLVNAWKSFLNPV